MKNIAIVVLAAGRAQRFGTAKLAAELWGKPVLHWALEAACESAAADVILVTGAHADQLARLAAGFDVRIVHNRRYADGIGSSIACGMAAVPTKSEAGLLMLADQPLVTAEHLRRLVTTWRDSACDAVATDYGDADGPPVLFAAACFARLRRLTGDTGARAILEDERLAVRTVACESAAVDIDTRADLENLEAAQSREEK